MYIHIELTNGHCEDFEVASWAIKDGCLQVQSQDKAPHIDTIFYPLNNVIKFIPGGACNENRYVK